MSPDVSQEKTDHIMSKKIPAEYRLKIHCQHGGKPF